MQDLGGSAVFMDHRHVRLGTRESIRDMARNLERWVHGIVARTYKHKAIEELAANCSIPVINGLSDYQHPCQALADFFTLTEKWGDVKGRKLVYVGDGNNTCHSLVHVAARLGADITVCSPEGYEPNARIINEAMLMARESGSDIRILNDPDTGVRRGRGVHGRVGEHGAGRRDRGAVGDLQRLPGRRGDDTRRSPVPISCTACRRTAGRR
jgi:ornithine carbamoyltransferase